MRKQFLLTILMIMSCAAFAADFEIDGYSYTIISTKDKTVEVDAGQPKGIIIPETVTYSNITFTVIGVRANFSVANSVTLPSTIEYLISSNHYGRVVDPLCNVYINDLPKFLKIEKRKDKYPYEEDEGFYRPYNLYLNNQLVKEISFPEDCDSITNILKDCQNKIENLYIPKNVKKIADGAFSGCKNLKHAIIEGEIVYLSSSMFSYCTNLESVTLPQSIECIYDNCFYDCESLKNITLPQNLTSIRSQTFSNCISLKEITIPQNVFLIGSGAFRGCISLKEITIPQKVFSIHSSCFSGCVGLEKVVFEGNYHDISDNVFEGCSEITEIVSNQNQLTNLIDGTFSKLVNMVAILKVPVGLKSEYMNHEGWNLFENIVEDPNCKLFTNYNDEFIYKFKRFNKTEYSNRYIYEIESKLMNNSSNTILLRKFELSSDELSLTNVPYDYSSLCSVAPNNYYDFSWKYIDYKKLLVSDSFKKVIHYYSDNVTNYILETSLFPQTHKLVYLVDNEVYKTVEVKYGFSITPEAVPQKEGYSFSGWSDIPKAMPDHAVTVTGTFNINSYKLTYVLDDKVYKETMYEYGATITPEPQPEGDFATFEWTNLPQTMPAHDVVVYANYTSGIIDVLMATRSHLRIYSPNGKKLEKLHKGLNIVILDDGNVKKIVVK